LSGFQAIRFAQHRFEPLIYMKNDLVDVRPAPLIDGEKDFVLDLWTYQEEHKDFFKDKELYLLRNSSRFSQPDTYQLSINVTINDWGSLK
jgi:hypothetical protein